MNLIDRVSAINWNRLADEKDAEVWHRLTGNFWLPEKVPVSNDIQSWNTLNDHEKQLTMRVFTGLTLLDTIQGTVGAVSLIPDAVTPHEEAVLANIAFMERTSGDTELLTPGGWKQIKDVTVADKVAQFEPETGEVTFAHPTRVLPGEWRDECYEIVSHNGNARQVVSAGHRVYFEQKKRLANDCDEWESRVCEARELLDINLNSSHRRFRSTGRAPQGAPMTAIDRLKVAIAADGSFKGGSSPRCNGSVTGTVPCHFTFSKPRKAERLRQLAMESGWRLTEHALNNGRRTFSLAVPLEHVDRDKRFAAWWSLDSLGLEWAREFVAEAGLWDGHTLKGGYGVTFYTTDPGNSDFFVAVASLAGYRSRTTVRVDDRSERFADSFVTNVSFSKSTVNAQSMIVKEAEPQMMYCVQVPTSFLLTRNGESPVVSGNCVHAKSYSNIFSTLCSTAEIDDAFRWSEENPSLQRKAATVMRYYTGDDPLKRKVASTLLESFLFYSGFYLPLYWSSRGKLTNTADMIRLIIRDECLVGDTELLTPQGWKRVSEISTSDTVAQYTPTGAIEFVHPIRVSSHVAAQTFRLENAQGHVQQQVSPNHRVIMERGGELIEKRAYELRPQDLDTRTQFVNTGTLSGGNCDILSARERILIAVQADGSFDRTLRSDGSVKRDGSRIGTVPCRFSFAKERKSDRLKQLAGEAGLRLGYRGHDARGRDNWELHLPIDEYPRDKLLSSIRDLSDVSAQWCQEFIDEVSHWDGHIVRENPARITYGSTVRENSQWVQAVATLAGYRTHWGVRNDGRKDSFQPIYRVQINRNSRRTSAQAVKLSTAPGQRVYGVEVPSSYLVTRLNGGVCVTGNSVHGYYIGYKYQKGLTLVDETKKQELKDYTYELLFQLYDNEVEYTQDLYDSVGLTEDVKKFLRYNANKALMNLGYEALFPKDETDVNAAILSALAPNADENHDFFSGSGSSYVIGKAVVTEDDDWDF